MKTKTEKKTHVRYIAKTSDGLYGHYGIGETESEALANLKAAGGAVRKSGDEYKPTKGHSLCMIRFTSKLPFAPSDREATKKEAEAFIGQDGAVYWIRCEREYLWEIVPAKAKK